MVHCWIGSWSTRRLPNPSLESFASLPRTERQSRGFLMVGHWSIDWSPPRIPGIFRRVHHRRLRLPGVHYSIFRGMASWSPSLIHRRVGCCAGMSFPSCFPILALVLVPVLVLVLVVIACEAGYMPCVGTPLRLGMTVVGVVDCFLANEAVPGPEALRRCGSLLVLPILLTFSSISLDLYF